MEAKIYVGTYGKYNAGSLFGKWLDLTEYSDKDEFYEVCKELHKGEQDPEYMFQDYEGVLHDMPKHWVSESSISEEVFEFLDYFKHDEERGEAFLNWISMSNYTGDFGYLISQFEEAYQGKYDSARDFAEQIADDMGWYTAMEKMGMNPNYFDIEFYTREIFMSDYSYSDGVVYRNI
jgi:antirestriction protein